MRPFSPKVRNAQQIMREILITTFSAAIQPTAEAIRQHSMHHKQNNGPVVPQKTVERRSQQTQTLFQPENLGRKTNKSQKFVSPFSIQRDQETTQAGQSNLFVSRRTREDEKWLTQQRKKDRRAKQGEDLIRHSECNLS